MNTYLNLINTNLVSEVKKPILGSFGFTKSFDLVNLIITDPILSISITLILSTLLLLLSTPLIVLSLLVDGISMALFSLVATN